MELLNHFPELLHLDVDLLNLFFIRLILFLQFVNPFLNGLQKLLELLLHFWRDLLHILLINSK